MRISSNTLFRQGLDAMLRRQVEVGHTQTQLGTGKRILAAADDPSGAATAQRLQAQLGRLAQFQRNMEYTRARLGQEEGALDGVTQDLIRVRELAIAAGRSSLADADRRALATEIRQIRTDLMAHANTRDASGEYVFAGLQSHVRPFVMTPGGSVSYAGDEGQRLVDIDQDQRIAVADSGHAVFRDILNGNGDFVVQADPANPGIGVIDPGTVLDPLAYDGETYALVLASATSAEGGTPTFTDTGTNDALGYTIRVNGVLVDTIAEGETRSLADLATAINAVSADTGVTAYVDGGLYLSNTAPGGRAITVTETLIGASEDSDTLVGFFGSRLSGLGQPSADVVLGPAADAFVVLDDGGAVETAGAYVDGAAIEFSGIRTAISGAPETGDRFTLAPSARQDVFTTVSNLIDALEAGASDGTGRARLQNALNRALVDLDRALEHTDRIRSSIGARLASVDRQEAASSGLGLQLRSVLTSIEDLDYTEAAARLSRELFALQAAQQSLVRLQGLSLFNLLG